MGAGATNAPAEPGKAAPPQPGNSSAAPVNIRRELCHKPVIGTADNATTVRRCLAQALPMAHPKHGRKKKDFEGRQSAGAGHNARPRPCSGFEIVFRTGNFPFTTGDFQTTGPAELPKPKTSDWDNAALISTATANNRLGIKSGTPRRRCAR